MISYIAFPFFLKIYFITIQLLMSPSRERRRKDAEDGEALPVPTRPRLQDEQTDDPQRRVDEEQERLRTPPPRAEPRSFRAADSKYSRFRQFVENNILPSSYEHEALSPDPRSDEIRLLNVRPGKPGSSIHCYFHVVSLEHASNYEALSYYWGTEDANKPINIGEPKAKSTGKKKVSRPNRKSEILMDAARQMTTQKAFHVRPNLYQALEQLRSKKRDIVLWVDALCINQENEIEKTEQVKKMARIYSRAHRVLVWLGHGNQKCEKAMDFLHDILNLQSFDAMVKDENSPIQWDALVQLMRCDWFSRRWVVQELALAKNATLHYNKKEIKWKDFASAIAKFATRFDVIKKLFLPSREFKHNEEHLGEIEALGANTLVDVTANHFRRSEGAPEGLERLSSLESLVSRLLRFEASDPRDTVYALLSICNTKPGVGGRTLRRSSTLLVPDSIESKAKNSSTRSGPGSSEIDVQLVPDYTKTIIEVYRDYTQYCVTTSRSIDIICRHWAPAGRSEAATTEVRIVRKRREKNPQVDAKMPSWVPLLKDSPFGAPRQKGHGRVNGDSLVGHPDRKCYNADGGKYLDVQFESIPLGASYTQSKVTVRIILTRTEPRPTSQPPLSGTIQSPERLPLKEAVRSPIPESNGKFFLNARHSCAEGYYLLNLRLCSKQKIASQNQKALALRILTFHHILTFHQILLFHQILTFHQILPSHQIKLCRASLLCESL